MLVAKIQIRQLAKVVPPLLGFASRSVSDCCTNRASDPFQLKRFGFFSLPMGMMHR